MGYYNYVRIWDYVSVYDYPYKAVLEIIAADFLPKFRALSILTCIQEYGCICMEPILLDSKQVAELISCSVYAVRASRSSGKLLGVDAPYHITIGSMVRYRRDTIEAWAGQFEPVCSIMEPTEGI